MKGTNARSIGLVVAVALLATSLPAHAFHCGTRIISRGDPATKMLHFCGEPEAIQTRLAQRSVFADFGQRGRYIPGFVEDIWIEEWTYNLGPSKLIRVVRVENGIVAEIRHLGYGY